MTAPLSLTAYRLATTLATPLVGPYLSARLKRGKEDPERIGERRGRPSLPRPSGRVIWLHGASVGEAVSLLPFVDRITRSGAGALVTTGTVTSAGLLAQRLPAGALHQYAPIDNPIFLRRFLNAWRPNAALVAESELWPNMIMELKRVGAMFPDALTLIAPRHPERGAAILRELEALGLSCALRSRGELPGPQTAVYICDTIGELGLFYRLAGVVFVGKSFAGGGGQNPIEPARLACALLHGPMVGNFSDAYAALDEAGGALEIARPELLGEALLALFANPARLRQVARAAGDAVERRAGAIERSFAALAPILTAAGAGW